MKTKRQVWGMIGLILLAGCLTACDPASFAYLEVNRVGIIEQKPYLRVYIKWSTGLGMDYPQPGPYYASLDEGMSWQEVAALPEDPLPVVDAPDRGQHHACVTQAQQVCYRLSGQSSVEISTDGGQSWQIDWQIPGGRQEYQGRQPEMEDLLDVSPDAIPYDLAILETGNGHVVLVAYGNQGVLVKSTDGVWNRVAVLAEDAEIRAAAPLPTQAPDQGTVVRVLATENVYLLLLAITGLILFTAVGWLGLVKKAVNPRQAQITRLSIIVFLSVTAFGLLGYLFVITHQGGSPHDWEMVNNMLVLVCLLPMMLLIAVMFAIGGDLPNQKYVWRAGLLALGLALGFFILTWLPFGLWARGSIAQYSQAWLWVVLLFLLDFIFSFVAIGRFVSGVPAPAEVAANDELPGQENTVSSGAEK